MIRIKSLWSIKYSSIFINTCIGGGGSGGGGGGSTASAVIEVNEKLFTLESSNGSSARNIKVIADCAYFKLMKMFSNYHSVA